MSSTIEKFDDSFANKWQSTLNYIHYIDIAFVLDEELDNLIKENVSMTWIENKVSYTCKICFKVGSHKVNMFNHIETHLEGFQHSCSFCGKVRKTREALRVHIYNEHKKKETLY